MMDVISIATLVIAFISLVVGVVTHIKYSTCGRSCCSCSSENDN